MLPFARFRSTFITLLSLIALCAQLTEVVVRFRWYVLRDSIVVRCVQAGKCWTGYDCNSYATSTITANGVKYCCYLNGGFPSITQINSVTTCDCGNADEEGLLPLFTAFNQRSWIAICLTILVCQDVRRPCCVPTPTTVPIPMATAARKGWPPAAPRDRSVRVLHLSLHAASILMVSEVSYAKLQYVFS